MGERAMHPTPRKRFGQHFLTDSHYLARIVKAIAPRSGESMVEIGPGTGALTERLADVIHPLHVVEIDRDLAAALRSRFPPEQVVVHEGDALAFDFSLPRAPLRVVGNLPYNISTPILFHVAAFADRIADCTFMLQKEVVNRMAAEPASADYGRLSVMLQYRFAVDALFRVPPGAFTPPPKVDSAVVRLKPLPRERPRARDDALFARIVMAAFTQRRKTLRNALKSIDADDAFGSSGIDLARRGETLGVAEFVALADSLRPTRP